jgi:hypothetical protein
MSAGSLFRIGLVCFSLEVALAALTEMVPTHSEMTGIGLAVAAASLFAGTVLAMATGAVNAISEYD